MCSKSRRISIVLGGCWLTEIDERKIDEKTINNQIILTYSELLCLNLGDKIKLMFEDGVVAMICSCICAARTVTVNTTTVAVAKTIKMARFSVNLTGEVSI